MASPKIATVFVVDDRVVPRMAAKAMLDGTAELRHVGEAASAEEALKVLPSIRPDLVLLDVEMPAMGGAELAARLTECLPGSKLLAWTVSEASDDLIRMLKAGCSGYVLKDSGPDEMRRALLAALRDDAPIPRKMLPEVIRRFVPPPGAASSDVRLTPREGEVLKLLAKGVARKQMASALGISIASIDTHVKSLYRKLGASSQTEAVNAGLRLGLVKVEDL